MNELKLVSQNGQVLADSREIATMTNKRHADLIRDIENYIHILENAKLRSQDFFIESSYKANGNNKTYKNYLLTKIGCDMVANKMTGTKGVLFTAAYTKKFEQMEKELAEQNRPQTQLEILQGTINQLVEQDKRVAQLEGKVDNISNIVSITSVSWREKVSVILKKIAKNWTGVEPYRSVVSLSYDRFEKRAGCNLNIRLKNRKERAAAQGMSKTYVRKINRLDVIQEEKRLVEIYLQVVKEMALEFRVDVNDFQMEEVM